MVGACGREASEEGLVGGRDGDVDGDGDVARRQTDLENIRGMGVYVPFLVYSVWEC